MPSHLDEIVPPENTVPENAAPPQDAPTIHAVSSGTNWVASGFQDRSGTILLIRVPSPSVRVQCTTGHPICALAFSPGEPLWLACAHSNSLITTWSVQFSNAGGGVVLFTRLKHVHLPCSPEDGKILTMTWSSDGIGSQIIACYEHGYVCRWYPFGDKHDFDRFGVNPQRSITFGVFSPDSGLLACGGPSGLCCIWNVEDRRLQATLEGDPESTILGAQFEDAPGSHRIVTWCNANNVRTWDTMSGAALSVTGNLSATVRDVSFSPGGKLLVALGNGDVVLCGQGSDVFTSFYPFRDPSAATVSGTVATNSVCFSPGGEFIVAAAADGTVYLWEARDVKKPPIKCTKHKAEAMLVAFNDGDLVSVGKDGSVHIQCIPADEPGRRVSIVRRLLSGFENSTLRKRSFRSACTT